jgi:hypothetical protein
VRQNAAKECLYAFSNLWQPCAKRHAHTGPYSAIHVAAAFGIVDAIAVAHIEAASAAILPHRVLDEPGEGPWKGWIELPGVDPLGDGGNDVGAAAGPVAGHAIQVGSLSLVVTPVRGKRRCSWHWQDSAVLHRAQLP